MQFSVEEELQQFFEPRGFRNINQFARDREEVGPAASFESHSIEVLDVNDAKGLIQVAFFAERKTRIPRLFCDIHAFCNTGFCVKSTNLLPRKHHLAGNAPSQIQRVQNNVPAKG